MEIKEGNGSNTYGVERIPADPPFAIGLISWIIALVILFGGGYGIYRGGKYIYDRGKSDIKTEFIKQMASSQYGEVDEFAFAHINGGVLITYNFRPFAEKKK